MTREKQPATARVLQWGVFLSCVLLVVGLAMSSGKEEHLDARNVVPELGRLLSGDYRAIMHAGIIVLLLTPFLRVLTLLVDFIRSGERSFVFISLGVLLLLIISSAVGFR